MSCLRLLGIACETAPHEPRQGMADAFAGPLVMNNRPSTAGSARSLAREAPPFKIIKGLWNEYGYRWKDIFSPRPAWPFLSACPLNYNLFAEQLLEFLAGALS